MESIELIQRYKQIELVYINLIEKIMKKKYNFITYIYSNNIIIIIIIHYYYYYIICNEL